MSAYPTYIPTTKNSILSNLSILETLYMSCGSTIPINWIILMAARLKKGLRTPVQAALPFDLYNIDPMKLKIPVIDKNALRTQGWITNLRKKSQWVWKLMHAPLEKWLFFFWKKCSCLLLKRLNTWPMRKKLTVHLDRNHSQVYPAAPNDCLKHLQSIHGGKNGICSCVEHEVLLTTSGLKELSLNLVNSNDYC